MLDKARQYIATCVDEFKIDMKEKKILSIGVKLPKSEGLALFLGVSRSRLYEWANENEEFRDILETVNQEQVIRLIDGGLSGRYNPTIAKLVLAKHGYKEETAIEHSGEIKENVVVNKKLEKLVEDFYKFRKNKV